MDGGRRHNSLAALRSMPLLETVDAAKLGRAINAPPCVVPAAASSTRREGRTGSAASHRHGGSTEVHPRGEVIVRKAEAVEGT